VRVYGAHVESGGKVREPHARPGGAELHVGAVDAPGEGTGLLRRPVRVPRLHLLPGGLDRALDDLEQELGFLAEALDEPRSEIGEDLDGRPFGRGLVKNALGPSVCRGRHVLLGDGVRRGQQTPNSTTRS
jgi:hypothetical protein